MKSSATLFNRFISHPRRPWIALVVSLLLILVPFAVAYFGEGVSATLGQGQWRGVLLPPIMIIYILVIAPLMEGMETRVIQSIRPLVLIDDDQFNRLVDESSFVRPRNEIIAFCIGVLLGVLTALRSTGLSASVLILVWFLSMGLMYGLLVWTIYVAVASSRMTGALLHQPLKIDPFDITPFEAIGRQSLVVALVFVGGITLSLIFMAFQPNSIRLLEFWLYYIPIASVPVILFFLNMQPTHKAIVSARQRELETVKRHIQAACRGLVARLDVGQDTGNLAAEINALESYERRLQAARTWPYNTTMLRTLFFSILIPAVTAVGRLLLEMALE